MRNYVKGKVALVTEQAEELDEAIAKRLANDGALGCCFITVIERWRWETVHEFDQIGGPSLFLLGAKFRILHGVETFITLKILNYKPAHWWKQFDILIKTMLALVLVLLLKKRWTFFFD